MNSENRVYDQLTRKNSTCNVDNSYDSKTVQNQPFYNSALKYLSNFRSFKLNFIMWIESLKLQIDYAKRLKIKQRSLNDINKKNSVAVKITSTDTLTYYNILQYHKVLLASISVRYHIFYSMICIY